MGFLSAAYRHFRNLEDVELDLDAPEVFLVGENGQGKTNFIESIYLLCYGGSFRTFLDARLVRAGELEALVRGRYCSEDGVPRDISVLLSKEGEKAIRVDAKPIRDRLQLIENIPCVLFAHQDLQYIIGPPEMRRKFFNQVLSLFDPLFVSLLRSYRKALKSRNLLLKNGDRELLSAFSQSLAELGLRIQERRAQIVEEFNRTLTPLFRGISALEEEVRIQYQPSWNQGSTAREVVKALERHLERDLLYETTTSGPHRDRFVLLQNGREFAPLASTGQVRLGSLILRVAQARFYVAKTGRRPVLLLDDVLLELDSGKRERFLKEIPGYEQAFYTFLPDEQFLSLRRPDTLVYRVVEGAFVR